MSDAVPWSLRVLGSDLDGDCHLGIFGPVDAPLLRAAAARACWTRQAPLNRPHLWRCPPRLAQQRLSGRRAGRGYGHLERTAGAKALLLHQVVRPLLGHLDVHLCDERPGEAF